MPPLPSPVTALSAPGKVLLTGGYLVLDRNYTGTVFALDARIHAIVQQLRRSHRRGTSGSTTETKPTGLGTEAHPCGAVVEDQDAEDTIVVRSPQFVDAVWEYGVQRCDNGGGVQVLQKGNGPRNPFVETSLNYALTYISYVADSKDFGSLSVTILADNDYYSETATSRGTATKGHGARFANFGVPLFEAHKTGLGSSAALVTALVSALVIHRTMQAEDLGNGRDKLHNLAQAAHCAAQGKVGSGFDVASAVYGSCLYKRFTPAILESVGDVGTTGFEERLFRIVEDVDPEHPWDTECVDFGMQLPRGMQMVLCDVECGSQTPSMVKKVLEWRKNSRREADILWAGLQNNNERLRQELKRLAQHPDAITDTDFSEISTFIQRSRVHLRTMTSQTGVPIEPKVQTELLDRITELDGVIGGVVPGAGGYDAIALLIRDDPAVIARLNEMFQNYESAVEDDFGGKIGNVRLLGVRHGSEGVKNEMLDQYAGWV
ncbi:Phosphomevalonate kinase eukaryotic [Penicillium argentinense]|uniref:Phosphomevalonate kinase n=1 Tax=Penicillium argentinense TaxID=1131581 RepID=A0A9W9KAM9_9EURO|nr:Phosphomevalonate kinase eukaryotic [Penicillium argentinense]KAJ5098716.1 Phosphomevalonate kinase eukaryotic [Penicillium argentinense]